MKGRARQNEAIDDGGGHTGRHALIERSEHAAGRGAVQIKRVAITAEEGRSDEGLLIHDGQIQEGICSLSQML